MDFGAFVAITPNKDGLVHISQISEESERCQGCPVRGRCSESKSFRS